MEANDNMLIYQSEDGKIKIDVRFENETVWLSLDQMAILFGRDKSTISRHIKNIFEEGELQAPSVVANYATTATDGKTYQVDYYNLDVIISVGYRVKATEMRSRGECVISGFNSKLEQDVLHFLLKGNQPIILVLARRMYKVIPKELQEALAQNRLLIVSVSNAARQSKDTAMMRNKWVCQKSDRILFVGVTERSSLYSLKTNLDHKQKMITLLNSQ